MCGCPLSTPYWGPALQPGMCPDWESNLRLFGSQTGAQSTEPRQPGLIQLSLVRMIHQLMRTFVSWGWVLFLKHPSGVSNLQPTGHMQPRMAVNVAQPLIINLLKTF